MIGRVIRKVLMALVAVTVLVLAAPAGAQAAANSICHDGSYGGNWYCGYGARTNTFPTTKVNEIYVIGTDYAIWTRWRSAKGVYSSWTSLGGQIRRSYSGSDFVLHECGTSVFVSVVGTNNVWYDDLRSPTGVWSGWQVDHGVLCPA